MKKFYVDFSGCVTIEAETINDVKRKFWCFIYEDVHVSPEKGISDDDWEVDNIEEITSSL